jgi:hypothetical protein
MADKRWVIVLFDGVRHAVEIEANTLVVPKGVKRLYCAGEGITNVMANLELAAIEFSRILGFDEMGPEVPFVENEVPENMLSREGELGLYETVYRGHLGGEGGSSFPHPKIKLKGTICKNGITKGTVHRHTGARGYFSNSTTYFD